MNILILNYEYPPLGGGAGIGTKAIAEEFVTLGHKVTVITTKALGLSSHEIINGVEVYRVPVIGRGKLYRASWISLFSWPFASLALGFWLCLKNKFDIINTHFFAPTGPTGTILSTIFRVPNVIYAHGGDVFDPDKMNTTPSGKSLLSWLLRISMRIQAKFASAVVTQTSSLKSKILQILPNASVHTLPLPFYPSKIEPKGGFSHSGLRLVAMGRVVERKGFQFVVEALKSLPQDVYLTIIGDGKYMDNLQRIVADLGLTDRIEFTGFISADNSDFKFQKLLEADVFVMPSTYEPMGIVVLEAMSIGLPIITTNSGGQVDIVQHNRNGIVVNPKSAEELANAVNELYNHREFLKKYSINNLEDIIKYYPQTLIKQYEAIFKRAI